MIYFHGILIFLAFVTKTAICQQQSPATCGDPYSSAVVNPTSKVSFGVTIDLRSTGYGYGCRDNFKRNAQYLTYYYVVNSILNKNSGELFGQTVTDYFIPGIPLGFTIYDDCTRPELSIKNIVQMVPQIGSEKKYAQCKSDSLFLGVIGPNDFDGLLQSAAVLKEYKIPQIVYTTLPKPDIKVYPHLFKVLAPEYVDNQMKMTIQLLKDLKWTRVSMIFETTEQIQTPVLRNFLDLLEKESICVSQVIYINSVLSVKNYQDILQRLLGSLPDTSGVIVFSISEDTLQHFFEAICDFEDVKKLHWIFMSLSLRTILLQYLNLVRGSFVVTGDANIPKSFFDYVMTIDASTALTDNPWFKPLYSSIYNCRLDGLDFQPIKPVASCPSPFKISAASDIGATFFINPSIDSVFIFAIALKAAWSDKCQNKPGVCDNLLKMESSEFQQKYLKTISFTYGTDNRAPPEFIGRKISFDQQQVIENKALPINVLNLQRVEENNQGFMFVEVFRYEDNNLQKKAPYKFYGIHGEDIPDPPPSTCTNCDKAACVKSNNIP